MAAASKPDLLVIVGDGRAVPGDMDDVAAALSPALRMPVQPAFMHFTAPSVGEGILNGILEHRPGRAIVLPLFIGASAAQKSNLHQIVDAAKDRWREVALYEAQPPGVHPAIVEAYQQLIVDVSPSPISADETALLVLGRGSRDAESNAQVYQMARLLWERFPVGALEVGFYGATVPDIPSATKRCVQNGARRIIVVPYVLYDSHAYAAICAQAVSLDTEIVITPPLGIHDGVIEAVRQRVHEALSAAHSHGGLNALLPPRYQGDVEVSAAPMAAADLIYDSEGRVAWDQIWSSFCDLALAGGPPHRGTLLEPPMPEQVRADSDGYRRVLAELARGIQMITRLPVVTSASPGWIGVQCNDEEMALWLLRAIVVENVSVRREGDVLYLPAGPGFRLEHEIKNVITVMAKTHHYWTEHISTAGVG